MRASFVLATTILLWAFEASAEPTNNFSGAEIQGQQLAQEILSQRPAENANNKGEMQIRDETGHRSEIPIVCTIFVTVPAANTNIIIPNWDTFYQAILTNKTEYLWVEHTISLTNVYSDVYTDSTNANDILPLLGDTPLVGHNYDGHQVYGLTLMSPFAGSDFWIADLGLEFFHWPDQKIIKHETRRTRACAVLESINPHPSAGGYSRVDTWIDNETLGVVHAEAYDASGKLLKVFDPKSFKKVNGQWELQDMEIRNVQTGSRTWIKFDMNSGS